MMIKNIDITNYRGIENLHIDFHEGINLLIGNNGAGKTSLLNALGIMLCEVLQRVRNIDIYQMTIGNNAFTTISTIGESVKQPVPHYPVSLKSSIIYQNREYLCNRIKINAATMEESKNPELYRLFKEIIGKADSQVPMLCFIQAGRNKISKEINSTVTLATSEVERAQGYQNAFSEALNISNIQQWCLQMEFAEYQEKKVIREYAAFQDIVSRFMSFMNAENGMPHIYFASKIGAIIYADEKTEQPIYQLSAGYQAALSVVLELAYRAVILNPKLKDIATETTGVVLIDEIEMHLHPAWQWRILKALAGTFPKVQFIIATHSPIILSSAEGASLYMMKSPNEVLQIDNVYGYSINEVLSLPQGSQYQPKEIQKYYQEAENIFETGNTEKLNDLIRRIEDEFKDSPQVIKDLKDFIEVNRWVEEA